MSSLEPVDIERVKRALDKEKQHNVVEERIRPTVVRRRAVKRDDEEEVVEARPSQVSPAPRDRDRDRDEPATSHLPPAQAERVSAPQRAPAVQQARSEIAPSAP
ncbi:MAG TPA: hypothetical protein VJV78_02680, partial [Polyangiales bacterium]|nr:hypothetical protein [Polyangiales bacterium]